MKVRGGRGGGEMRGEGGWDEGEMDGGEEERCTRKRWIWY